MNAVIFKTHIEEFDHTCFFTFQRALCNQKIASVNTEKGDVDPAPAPSVFYWNIFIAHLIIKRRGFLYENGNKA